MIADWQFGKLQCRFSIGSRQSTIRASSFVAATSRVVLLLPNFFSAREDFFFACHSSPVTRHSRRVPLAVSPPPFPAESVHRYPNHIPRAICTSTSTQRTKADYPCLNAHIKSTPYLSVCYVGLRVGSCAWHSIPQAECENVCDWGRIQLHSVSGFGTRVSGFGAEGSREQRIASGESRVPNPEPRIASTE